MTQQPTKEQRADRFDLRTLYETSGLLSSSLDLDFIANNLLLSAMSKLLAMRGALWMASDGLENHFVLRAHKGCRGLPAELQATTTLDSDAILTGGDIPDEFGQGFLQLLAPISFGSTVLGVLGLGGSARQSGFTSQEIEFVSSLVNMTSSAFQNSLTVDQLRSANRQLDGKIQQLNTLFDLSQEFNATVDRDRLVRLLTLSLMGQMLIGKHLFLMKREGDTSRNGQGTPRVDVVSAKGAAADGMSSELKLSLLTVRDRTSIDDKAAAETNADAIPAFDWLRAEGLEFVLPIKHQGETTAVMCLGPKMTGQPYTDSDVDFLAALGNLASVSITNSILIDEQLEKERLQQEMRLAREIQEKLQPSEPPNIRGLDVAYIALASQMVAGDYLDIIPLPEERALFAVGDVTGKGMPASLLMSNVQACLHVLLPMDLTLEEATAHINRVICGNTNFDKFITFFHGIFESRTHLFKYVNAGHNPPMVIHADGSSELLEIGGLLLGVMAGVSYESGTLELRPGDVVAIFTDGVTEAMSPEEEEYEEKRLLKVLVDQRGESAQGILDAVLADIKRFTAGVETLSDDLTMIVVKVDS